MPQLYLSEGNASAVRRCNQSRRTGEAISVSGLDLSGSFATFTGIVQSVEITQDMAKEKRFLVTIDEVGAT
ncbi:hypothetical protein ACH79_00460 [Bradyrhizobium sp. CCBAU 051011]|jgi:hypothetical protein|uniref:hypothetical protein n=1 Tax=Bradyrhizobium sp. CCBAU 051011 TaxID=858422 RepID=UPI001374252E|nr:hypothetical protein [Bradyrhizobium sp. CCBAU 051011]QHO71333.1 hypothetical protein ACH79_00460 [Bradyrhizobium sp. CCBAU 051011]